MQTPLSIAKLIKFGEEGANVENGLKSSVFLRQELPVTHMKQKKFLFA